MKLRSFFLILAGIAVVSLSVAGGSVAWVLAQSPFNLLSGGVVTNPSAAIFVPKQSPVVVSLLANPDRLEQFAQVAAPINARSRARAELTQIKTGLLANTGADYVRDVQPWLGDEITFALTSPDFDRDSNNGAQPGYLLVAESKDGQLAREFLQAFYAKDAIAGESELVSKTYKGVNLIYRRAISDNNSTSASAVVGDRFVLFANHPKVLRAAINNVQAIDRSLENSPPYQKALQTIQTPRIGVATINLPGLNAWISKQPLPPEFDQTLTVTLSLARQGLVAQSAIAGVFDEQTTLPALSAPVQALNYIPTNNTLTAAGADLQQFWEQLSTGLAPSSPFTQILNRLVARGNANLGLDLEGDIFNWVRGEYALSLLPGVAENSPSWLFVAQNNTPEATAGIERLDRLAKEQDLSLGNLALGDKKVTAWTELKTIPGEVSPRLEAKVKGVHTTVGNYEIFSSSLAGMERALGGENAILESKAFKRAIALLPKTNNGYFSLDWDLAQPLIEEKAPLFRAIEFAGRPLFNNLRAIVLSSSGREKGISRASAFLQLGTGDS
ncbi:DUF3352 domain-containing protein [Lusitaniella coriacea]|uniref:DUF3352 domain-containing protein n=1 Tax=Lusitaniella coriacea TaxID=1983105 RepID=UPI003CED2562